jgi:hypothetical protein
MNVDYYPAPTEMTPQKAREWLADHYSGKWEMDTRIVDLMERYAKMNRIDVIKERLQKNEGQFHKDKIALDEDVQYLLDKLEIAMYALEDIEEQTNSPYDVRIAEEALKKIKAPTE